MPGNFLLKNIDTEGQGDRSALIEEYIYLLVEQLRYTLSNLGEDNFNKDELARIRGLSCGANSIVIREDGIYLSGDVYINGVRAGGDGGE